MAEAGRQYKAGEQRALLIATCLGSIIGPLLSTMMNLALVHIGAEFSVGSRSLALINTVFFLASVVFIVPMARYASIKGMKRIFTAGTALICVGALFAAFSPTFLFLLLMRFVLGVGSAAVVVTSVTMVAEVYPLERRGWAIGFNTMFAYLGLALGPVIGGTIADLAGWRVLFAVAAPFAVAALVLLVRFPGEVMPAAGEPMDWRGSALWGLAILVTMLGVIEITQSYGPLMLVVGLVLLSVAVLVLSRTPAPVLDVRLFRRTVFRRSCGATFMNYSATYAVSFFMALYIESIGGLSASAAGFLMLIQPGVQVLLTSRFGALFDRIADKRLLPTLGMALMCVGLAGFEFLGTDFQLWQVVTIMLILGLATAMFAAPNTTTILSSVPPHFRGEAAGSLAVVRQAGIMTSMGLAMACIAVIMGSADNLSPATYGVFADVIHLAFAICLGMCAVGTVLSWARGNILPQR